MIVTRLWAKVAMFLAVTILWGCGPSVVRVYPGSELPPDKTALLVFHEPIRVYAVDGQQVSLNFGGIEMLPGSHTVSIGYVNYFGMGDPGSMSGYSYSIGEIHVDFDARAGHQYTVAYDRWGNSWKAWIEDEGQR
ncbi:MAG: hypothetical protein ACM3ON_01475 [Chloroflexota bacterium]